MGGGGGTVFSMVSGWSGSVIVQRICYCLEKTGFLLGLFLSVAVFGLLASFAPSLGYLGGENPEISLSCSLGPKVPSSLPSALPFQSSLVFLSYNVQEF